METFLKTFDEFHWEFTLAFETLEDGDVWRRAHPRLLSVGELAGHVSYWEAIRCASPGAKGAADISIKSPMIDDRFRYYSTSVDAPVDLGLGAEATLAEFKRVHEGARAALVANWRDDDEPVEGMAPWTWGQSRAYMLFHVSYHAGQAFSVRHLMGHKTNDN